jgi:hypothetical protein
MTRFLATGLRTAFFAAGFRAGAFFAVVLRTAVRDRVVVFARERRVEAGFSFGLRAVLGFFLVVDLAAIVQILSVI